jgi:hypothetical protein
MKAITTKQNFPKFLRVSGEIKKKAYNKFLQKPFVEGEIVKIVPFDEQRSVNQSTDKVRFLTQYVNIIRKDNNGKFTIRYTVAWDILEQLKK